MNDRHSERGRPTPSEILLGEVLAGKPIPGGVDYQMLGAAQEAAREARERGMALEFGESPDGGLLAPVKASGGRAPANYMDMRADELVSVMNAPRRGMLAARG